MNIYHYVLGGLDKTYNIALESVSYVWAKPGPHIVVNLQNERSCCLSQ